jgi:hypothetical protein
MKRYFTREQVQTVMERQRLEREQESKERLERWLNPVRIPANYSEIPIDDQQTLIVPKEIRGRT